MHFLIDKNLFDYFPEYKVGVLILKNINNERRVSTLESLLRGISAQRIREFKDVDLAELSALKAWDEAYKKVNLNPKKHKSSVIALANRMKKGEELKPNSPLVDICNYFSLKNLLPIGGEDLDWLCGDLYLKFAKGDEPFRKIDTIDISTAKKGELVFVDDGGITTKSWNYRECERTKFRKKTVNAAIFVEDINGMEAGEFQALMEEMAKAAEKYLGGEVQYDILNKDKTVLNLGINGRTHVDDSKIPKQEIQYFLQTHPDYVVKKEEKKKAPKVKKKKESISINDFSLARGVLKDAVENAVTKTFAVDSQKIKIDYTNNSKNGDYTCNIAMQLTKELGIPPREIAQKIVDNLESSSVYSKIEVAGPGFINFYLSNEYLDEKLQALKNILSKSTLDFGEQRKIIVEYSSPNIAKPFGVHHLLSIAIGNGLYNLFKYIGFDAISINHIGDFGTQFGKLICAYKKWGDRETVEKDPIKELLKLYIKFHKVAEEQPELEDEGREEFRKFEQGDEKNTKLWQWFVKESLKDNEKTYKELGGIHFDHTMGESFYADKTDDILKAGKEKGVFVEGNEGAYIVEYKDENIPPFVVQKKDGATLYSTRDLAALKYRIERWDPEKILYVVDVAQSMHFKQLFEAASRFDWYDGQGVHIIFGRMSMKDGKLSTRKGNTILLDEVLEEAIKRATEIAKEKGVEGSDAEKTGRATGIGALKYSIVSQNRLTNIVFDLDKMLSLEGNSAPYLQYVYARAKSILMKAEALDDNSSTGENREDKDEVSAKIKDLLVKLSQFEEHLLSAARDYKLNTLTTYLYELSQTFNSFYNAVHVLNIAPEDREYRLKIVDITSKILKKGLSILGIEVVEHM